MSKLESHARQARESYYEAEAARATWWAIAGWLFSFVLLLLILVLHK